MMRKTEKYLCDPDTDPWCGDCESIAPEYAAVATDIKNDGVILAKADATEENEIKLYTGLEDQVVNGLVRLENCLEINIGKVHAGSGSGMIKSLLDPVGLSCSAVIDVL